MNEIHDRKDRILNDRTQISFAYIDVGDACWAQNVLVTILRCWSPRSKFSHQHQQIDVTNITVTLVKSKEVKLKLLFDCLGSNEAF